MKPYRISHSFISVLTLILALAVTTAFATQPDKKAKAEQAGYQIGPENVLMIDVYYGRDKELSRKVRVSSKGYIPFHI